AAGSLRQKDPRVTASRPLRMVVHGVGRVEGGPEVLSQSGWYARLRDWGLPTSARAEVKPDLAAVQAFIDYYAEHRHSVEHEIDGVVVNTKRLDICVNVVRTVRITTYAVMQLVEVSDSLSAITAVHKQSAVERNG